MSKGQRAKAEQIVAEVVPDDFDQDVADEVARLRVRQAARDRFDAERAGTAPPFDLGTLTDVLARPAGPRHRVDDLIPADANTLVVAQRKTGKSTFVLNLARSLLTGERFLGKFDVVPVKGAVAVLNYEVSAMQIARWADEVGGDGEGDVGMPPERLVLVNLRGRRNPLGNTEDRAVLAAKLRSRRVESVLVDPFGRAYTGTSDIDNGEVGAYLGDLDRWCRGEVGATDVILTAHAGWNAERTRGASALEDWPDSIVTLTRGASNDDARYLRAEGRDVLVEEDRLDYDPRTRLLTMTGSGSRKTTARATKVDDLVPHVVDVVKAHPDITGNQLGQKLRDAGVSHQRGDENKALAGAVTRGDLTIRLGKGNAKHYTVRVPPTSPDLPRRGTSRPPPPSPLVGEVVLGELTAPPPPPPAQPPSSGGRPKRKRVLRKPHKRNETINNGKKV